MERQPLSLQKNSLVTNDGGEREEKLKCNSHFSSQTRKHCKEVPDSKVTWYFSLHLRVEHFLILFLSLEVFFIIQLFGDRWVENMAVVYLTEKHTPGMGRALHRCLCAHSSALGSLVVQEGLLWSLWIQGKSLSVFRVTLPCPLLGMFCYYWQGRLGRKQKNLWDSAQKCTWFFYLRTKSRSSSSTSFLVLIFSSWEKQSYGAGSCYRGQMAD